MKIGRLPMALMFAVLAGLTAPSHAAAVPALAATATTADRGGQSGQAGQSGRAGQAGQPGAAMADIAAREYRLAHELRCVVCQNQSLAESNAPLAADMRTVIREQLQAGRSDAEVMAFFEHRYGAFVSYTPPWRPSTWLLWLGPFLIALIGLVVLVRALRRHQATDTPPSRQDQERVRRFLGESRADESIAP